MINLEAVNPSLPIFPTNLHREVANIVYAFFRSHPVVDSVLVVNSCARGVAVAESDLDFAILIAPGISKDALENIEKHWLQFSLSNSTIDLYRQSGKYAHLHLDFITGQYQPAVPEPGGPIDFMEIEIGNQVCYSAPLGLPGPFYLQLKDKWLPYYDETLAAQRFDTARQACLYSQAKVSALVEREEYFNALDFLIKAFQEYLQALFIANRIYPIAYNKWIKEQIVHWLKKPELYQQLVSILSVSNIEGSELIQKAKVLGTFLDELTQTSQG